MPCLGLRTVTTTCLFLPRLLVARTERRMAVVMWGGEAGVRMEGGAIPNLFSMEWWPFAPVWTRVISGAASLRVVLDLLLFTLIAKETHRTTFTTFSTTVINSEIFRTELR